MASFIEDTRISAILDQPDAPTVLTRLNTKFEDEKKRSQQFYADYNDDVKVEFINGEVVVHSPVKLEHNNATGWLYKLLDTHVIMHDLGKVGIEKMMSSFTRNDYEPDVVFWKTEKSRHFEIGQWKFPVPDFVAEVVSDSTSKNDYNVKFKDYESHGVSEFWIIDPVEEWVEQYFLKNGHFVLHKKSGEGKIKSRAVEGFEIEIDAIFDPNANNEALRLMFLS